MAGKEGKLQCQYWLNGFIKKLMSRLTGRSLSTQGYLPFPAVFLEAYRAWCFPFSSPLLFDQLTSLPVHWLILWSGVATYHCLTIDCCFLAAKRTKQNMLILSWWWVKGVTLWSLWFIGLLETILQLLLFPYKESGGTQEKRRLLAWCLDKFCGLQMSCQTLA